MWKLRLHYDVVVKVLFQVLSALIATVAIVDSEDLNLGPLVFWQLGLLQLRLDHV